MKRAKNVTALPLPRSTRQPKLYPVPPPAEPAKLPAVQLATGKIASIEGARAVVVVSGVHVDATWDPSVSPVVLKGACARGERVLIERGADGAATIIGALRTQPTPGIDAAERYAIEAEHIAIRAGAELSLAARAATVVLRAAGEVETYADRIVARAESVHKIIGRMLRLN